MPPCGLFFIHEAWSEGWVCKDSYEAFLLGQDQGAERLGVGVLSSQMNNW